MAPKQLQSIVFFAILASLSIKDLGRVSKFLGMSWALDGEGGCVLDQEEVISYLLQEQSLTDANCYEVQSIDSVQLESKSTNGAPTIREF
uniref:Uncharacterized protein n=1 Tax=Peronospora matthiolae TaxID=2874970 RepID=A0AAV1VDD7_9STRA